MGALILFLAGMMMDSDSSGPSDINRRCWSRNGVRSLWKKEDLKEALTKVRNKEMSQKKASALFDIPRTTLRRYQHKDWKEKKSLGRQPLLTYAQEKALVDRILRLQSLGFPMRARGIQRSVYSFCLMNNLKNPFNENRKCAGKAWFVSFMKRHPQLSERKPQALNEARARKLNRSSVEHHFKTLKSVMMIADVENNPERIYNVDEKGIRLCQHKSFRVVAKRGTKRVYVRQPEHGENVTVVACVNALGNSIPPMILFKGKRCKPEWKDHMPPGTLVEMTPKGSMTGKTFIKFLEHLAKYKAPGSVTFLVPTFALTI